MTQKKENTGAPGSRFDIIEQRRFVFEDGWERECRNVQVRVYSDDRFSLDEDSTGAYTVDGLRVLPMRENCTYSMRGMPEDYSVDWDEICPMFIESISGASFDVVSSADPRRTKAALDALKTASSSSKDVPTVLHMMGLSARVRAVLALIETGAPGARVLTSGRFRTPADIIINQQGLLLSFRDEWGLRIAMFTDLLSHASYEDGSGPVELVARALQLLFPVSLAISANREFTGIARLLLAPAQERFYGLAVDAERLLERAFNPEQGSSGLPREYLAMMAGDDSWNGVSFLPASDLYSSLAAIVQRGASAAMRQFKPQNPLTGERIRYWDEEFTEVEGDKRAALEWRMASAVLNVLLRSSMLTSPRVQTPLHVKDHDIERFTAFALREGAARFGWTMNRGAVIVSAPDDVPERKASKAIRATRDAAERALSLLLDKDFY